jgi:hypothetical protein
MNRELLKVWQRDGEIRIKNLEDFVAQTNRFMTPRTSPKWERNQFLFRGVSNSAFELMPSLPRAKDDYPWLDIARMLHIEFSEQQQFQLKAPLYMDAKFIPTRIDITKHANSQIKQLLEWWQLMQHHGAKTRLLDWSASPFLAAYFAAAGHPKNDGAVWMVECGALADKVNSDFGLIVHLGTTLSPEINDDPHPEEAGRRSREVEATVTLQMKHMSADASGRMWFVPCSLPNHRMAGQQGWFSFAANIDQDHGEAIAAAFLPHPNRWWSQKLIIDSAAKCEIQRALMRMNVTGETVYRGLDGLGRGMSELVGLLAPTGKEEFGFCKGLLTTHAPNPLQS